jgi:hypothetical protein
MAYHHDLLQQASELAHKNPTNPKQADLRRAVSSAYYALFHLLIFETIANWSLDSSRNSLGRMFEHKKMKDASKRLSQLPFTNEDPTIVQNLKALAQIFVDLQDKRNTADYDNGTVWTLTQTLATVLRAFRAFDLWRSIQNQKIAQDYLVSLLIRPRD